MQRSYCQRFWVGGLLGACLALSPVAGSAQGGAAAPKAAKSKSAKKRAQTAPNADGSAPPPANTADLPLGVQDNLVEAKRLEEQYRREEAARRRAEAEARRKGLPWPPEETNPESQPPDNPPAQPQQTVSQPAPPLEYAPPPPANPPAESQMTTHQSGDNAQNPAEPPPPPPPADGKTVIRAWPKPTKKPSKSSPPQ